MTERHRPTRRLGLSSLVSYTGVQALIAISAFVRIPLLIHSLGNASFGLVTVIGGIAPLLLASSQGLRTASRTLAAEEIGKIGQLSDGTHAALRRAARRTGIWQLALLSPVIMLVPFASILHADRVVSRNEFTITFLVSAAMCALASPGAVRWGVLEAKGRISLVNSFFAIMTVLGLLITVIFAPFVHSLFLFGTINAATTALPTCLAMFVPSEWRRNRMRALAPSTTTRRSVRQVSIIGAARSGSPFASRALDPFVISAAIGPAAAASYGVAQRLSIIGTLVPIAALPFVTGVIARRRGAGGAVKFLDAAKLGGAYAAVAAVLGAALVAVGPRLGRALTGDHFEAGRSLFVALAVLGCVSSLEIGLASVGTGPRAMRFGLRVDIVTAVLNVALSFLLVHWMGMTGPVYASVIAVGLAAVAWLLVLARRPHLLSEIHDSTRASVAAVAT
ncbi:MAG: hypothetical protein JWN46_1748 [Acidimicrobiales bacterium]|nr:hypothetical protein [Acidimicrobiales bacterium]